MCKSTWFQFPLSLSITVLCSHPFETAGNLFPHRHVSPKWVWAAKGAHEIFQTFLSDSFQLILCNSGLRFARSLLQTWSLVDFNSDRHLLSANTKAKPTNSFFSIHLSYIKQPKWSHLALQTCKEDGAFGLTTRSDACHVATRGPISKYPFSSDLHQGHNIHTNSASLEKTVHLWDSMAVWQHSSSVHYCTTVDFL